jgi:hypothetical protein
LGTRFAEFPAEGLQNGLTLEDQSREDFFLIKDVEGNAIGFTMEILSDSAPEAQLNIQAVSLFYIQGRYAREQVAFFQSRNNLDEFAWRSEVSSSAGKGGTEVVLDKGGVMTVRKYGARTREKNYQFGPAAIPDVLGELAFSQMLDSDHKKIFVDVIISRIEAEDAAALHLFGKTGTQEGITYALKVEPLDGQGFSEQVYLDDRGRISKRLLQQESIYTLERTSMEDISRQFPERADYIKNKMLEQNQLLENSE